MFPKLYDNLPVPVPVEPERTDARSINPVVSGLGTESERKSFGGSNPPQGEAREATDNPGTDRLNPGMLDSRARANTLSGLPTNVCASEPQGGRKHGTPAQPNLSGGESSKATPFDTTTGAGTAFVHETPPSQLHRKIKELNFPSIEEQLLYWELKEPPYQRRWYP
jgi:hypothetical protein